jgi:hypothetical protein
MNLEKEKSRGAGNTDDSTYDSIQKYDLTELRKRQDKMQISASRLADALHCAALMMRGVHYGRK